MLGVVLPAAALPAGNATRFDECTRGSFLQQVLCEEVPPPENRSPKRRRNRWYESSPGRRVAGCPGSG